MITNAPPSGTQGYPYAFQFATSWSNILGCSPNLGPLLQGQLPPGLTLNMLSGDIGEPPNAFGTPLVAGTYTFTLAASTNTYCLPTPLETNAQTFTINIAPAASPSTPPGSSNWVKDGSNPAVSPSPWGWDGFKLSSPSVIKVGGTYFMYYETEDSISHTRRIGLATSADSKIWAKSIANPILRPGSQGVWDSFEVRYPSVHFDGTTYRMWYRGYDGRSAAPKIGLATSTDGVNWTKHASNPVFGAQFGGTGYVPGSVIKVGGQFVMWFNNGFGGIGRATSPDGITWTETGSVLDGTMNSRPSVILDGSTYRMWFGSTTFWGGGITGGASVRQAIVGYASSVDGIAWTVYQQNPSVCFFCVITSGTVAVLAPGSDWDRPGIGQPWVIKDGTLFKMWYTGGQIHKPMFGSLYSSTFVDGSIGLAVIP